MKSLLMEQNPFFFRMALVENGELTAYRQRLANEGIRQGSVYRGRVRDVVPGLAAAFVDIGWPQMVYLPQDEADPSGKTEVPIQKLLRPGDYVTVQIKREGHAQKAPLVSRRLRLEGKTVVLMPTEDRIGVSRKIEDPAVRRELYAFLETVKPEGMGLMARTAAADAARTDISQEIDRLMEEWLELEGRLKGAPVGAVGRNERNFAWVVDAWEKGKYEKVILQTREGYQNFLQFQDRYDFKIPMELYEGRGSLFGQYAVEEQLLRAMRPKIWLDAGAYLVVDYTEAMTVVDVNTGKFVGKRVQSDTTLQTNLQAARKIIRLMSLLNWGGMILVDFIDMPEEAHRKKVMDVMENAAREENLGLHVLGFTKLGLLEMTRKRRGDHLVRALAEPCPRCGKGRITDWIWQAAEAWRQLGEYFKTTRAKKAVLHLPQKLRDLERFEPLQKAIEASWPECEVCFMVDRELGTSLIRVSES